MEIAAFVTGAIVGELAVLFLIGEEGRNIWERKWRSILKSLD